MEIDPFMLCFHITLCENSLFIDIYKFEKTSQERKGIIQSSLLPILNLGLILQGYIFILNHKTFKKGEKDDIFDPGWKDTKLTSCGSQSQRL